MDESVERQRHHFNSVARRYQTSREHINHKTLKKAIWESFFNRGKIDATKVSSVIEPMCGMSEAYVIIEKNLKKKISYLGFDYSNEMVTLSQKANPTLNIMCADVTNFSTDQKFDMVVIIGGLHHVHGHVEKVLHLMKNILRPEGYFLSFEPTSNNAMFRAIRERIYRRNDLFDAETERGFEYVELCQIFESVGFKKVDEVFPGLLAYILYYNPDAFPSLNFGHPNLAKLLFSLDRLIWTSYLGRKLSFATISLWQKLS
jgi:SAM-dependent methyltransferase